jgi:hypothetical protein
LCTGSIFQALTLTFRDNYSSLRALHISEPLYLDKSTLGGVVQLLSDFRRITDLRVAFVNQGSDNKVDILQSMLEVCPQLLDLHLTIVSSPSIPLVRNHTTSPILSLTFYISQDEAAVMFKSKLPLLKKLVLGVVLQAHPPAMHVGAGAHLLATSLPRLRNLQICLYKAGEDFFGQEPPPPLELGEYEALRSSDGELSMITYFEGALLDDRLRKALSRLQGYTQRRVRRRYFSGHGWRWYAEMVEGLPLKSSHAFMATISHDVAGSTRVRFLVLAVIVPLVASLYLYMT